MLGKPSNEEVIADIYVYFEDASENHYRDGINKFEKLWNKYWAIGKIHWIIKAFQAIKVSILET